VWSDEFDSPLTLGVGYVPVGSTPNGNVVYDKYFQNGGATSGGALGPPPDVYPANSLFAGLGISPGALGSYNGFIPTGSTFYVPFYGSDHEGVSLEITLDRPYASGMWINLEMGSSLAGPYPFTTFYGNSNTVSGSVWFDGDNLRYLKASGVPPVQFADVNDNLLIGRTNFRLVVFKAGGILLLADDTVVTSVNYVDLTGFLAIDTFILGANNAKIDSFSISYATYSAIPDFWTSLVNTRELAQ
jgi:hypothetical protein